jgi:MbtH protein
MASSVQHLEAHEVDVNDPSRKGKFCALINHELQYSLWNADMAIPKGWKQEGSVGSKEDVLAYIEQKWTDMRPLSVQKQMAALSR